MAVDSVTGNAAANAAATAATSKSTMGSEQFLTLMVTQLKNQDPFKPVDATQYVSQLAQFSTVSGIQEMKQSLTSLSEALRSSQVLGGSTLVGHDVVADASAATLRATGDVRGTVEIPQGTANAALFVTDATGQVVRRVMLPTTPGAQDFTWDGLDEKGDRVAAGDYKLQAIANVGGTAEQLTTSLISKVESVTIDPTNYNLTLNTQSGAVALSAVRRVM
jgi:flagellar basal-body rod modification protein FlgD